MSNENHTFPADKNGNPITTNNVNKTTSTVYVFKDGVATAPSSITGTGSSSNLNIQSGTIQAAGTALTITASAGVALSGSRNIGVVVDSKTFTLAFSWSLAVAGQTGAHGINSCPVRLYKTSDSTPGTYPDTATYTFSTNSLVPNSSGSLNSWSLERPTTLPVWEITATALSNEDTDTIYGGNSSQNEWSEPLLVSGKNGLNGYNQATLYLYCRSSSTPTKPGNNILTYNFSNGKIYSGSTEITNTVAYNGWYRAQPTGENPL